MIFKFLEKRKKRQTFEQSRRDFRETGMLSGTPESNAAAYRLLDVFNDLHGGNPPIDRTPRVEGYPVVFGKKIERKLKFV